jgi:hypothetical protein
LKEKLEDNTFDVDSQAIFASIARFGAKETIPLLQGAWSLVWYDLNEETLNFLRNSERPMWFSYSKELDRLLWASEYHMLQAAAGLSSGTNKIELYTEDKTRYQCWETPVDKWLSFKMEQFLKPGESLPKPLSKTLKGKEPVVAAAAGSSDPFSMGGSTGGSTHSTTKSHSSDNRPDKRTVVTLLCNDDKPFGDELTVEEFLAIAEYGCSWCGTKVDPLDNGITLFARDQILLCPRCATGVTPEQSKKGASAKIYVKNLSNK